MRPGKRFQTYYRMQRESEGGKSVMRRALYLGGTALAFGIGVVLVFIPGPAVVFFALSGALLATQSLRVARALDWGEVKLRAGATRIHDWWKLSPGTQKAPVILAAALLASSLAAAAVTLLF